LSDTVKIHFGQPITWGVLSSLICLFWLTLPSSLTALVQLRILPDLPPFVYLLTHYDWYPIAFQLIVNGLVFAIAMRTLLRPAHDGPDQTASAILLERAASVRVLVRQSATIFVSSFAVTSALEIAVIWGFILWLDPPWRSEASVAILLLCLAVFAITTIVVFFLIALWLRDFYGRLAGGRGPALGIVVAMVAGMTTSLLIVLVYNVLQYNSVAYFVTFITDEWQWPLANLLFANASRRFATSCFIVLGIFGIAYSTWHLVMGDSQSPPARSHPRY
jgi:hypothetical protein